ncbi:hypothetical protein [Methylogaea oryzae]|nr:hypothetical protein [Methylogaea oryzae]
MLRRLIDSHPMVVAAYDLLSLALEGRGNCRKPRK